jgi:hypothetical protein
MGFYGLVPFDRAEVTYVWTGVEEPGHFSVKIWGHAQQYTYDVQLKQDSRWVCGLKVDVMGWKGPIGQGTDEYTATGAFPGQFVDKIIIEGSNKREVVPVKQIPAEQAEEYMQSLTAVAV